VIGDWRLAIGDLEAGSWIKCHPELVEGWLGFILRLVSIFEDFLLVRVMPQTSLWDKLEPVEIDWKSEVED
jgi:hypothetical protein